MMAATFPQYFNQGVYQGSPLKQPSHAARHAYSDSFHKIQLHNNPAAMFTANTVVRDPYTGFNGCLLYQSHVPTRAEEVARVVDNCSPLSMCSNSSWSYDSDCHKYNRSPISRLSVTPSPPTTATASKLYNLLKYPESTTYSTDDTWGSPQANAQQTQEIKPSRGFKRNYNSISEDAPIDLSCKRARVESEDNSKNRSILQCILNGKGKQGLEMDMCSWSSLESRSNFCNGSDDGRQQHPLNLSSPHRSCTPDSRFNETHSMSDSTSISSPSSPSSVSSSSFVHTTNSHQTHTNRQAVCLAKKNLFPVTARVTDWIMKIIQFSHDLPEFTSLPHPDKVKLLLSSWVRLLLLQMAETGFEFAVSAVSKNATRPSSSCSKNSPPSSPASPPSSARASSPTDFLSDYVVDETEQDPATVPTMESVEKVQRFIQKYQQLNIDQKEYHYLKLLTLFNPADNDSNNRLYYESVCAHTRQAFESHLRQTKPEDKTRYTRMLLALPSLYGINCSMVENLFCYHIPSPATMHNLLQVLIDKD